MARLAVSHFDRKRVMWPEDQILAEMPVALEAPARLLLLSALALASRVACNVASCGRILLPALLVPLLMGCYCAAIVLTATARVRWQALGWVWFTSLSV